LKINYLTSLFLLGGTELEHFGKKITIRDEKKLGLNKQLSFKSVEFVAEKPRTYINVYICTFSCI